MKKYILSLLITLGLTAVPAYARGDRHYRDNNNTEEAIAAGIIGLAIGVMISDNGRHRDRYDRDYENYDNRYNNRYHRNDRRFYRNRYRPHRCTDSQQVDRWGRVYIRRECW
jgi:hypothetical protein